MTMPASPAPDRRHTGYLVALGLLLVVAAAVVITLIRQDDTSSSAEDDLQQVSGIGAAAPPPWTPPADVEARARAAGLSLGAMGMAEHYHVHVDVLVNERSITVPANIGVDPISGAMTGLHTHTPDGVVHVEAAENGQVFTLGQLFTQWDVRLADDRLGALRATGGNDLSVYVNGEQIDSDLAMIRLADGQQITVVFAAAGQPSDIPTAYDFDG